MLNREAIVHEVEECLRILADKAGEIPTTGYAGTIGTLSASGRHGMGRRNR